MDHWAPQHQVRRRLQLSADQRCLHRQLRWRVRLRASQFDPTGFRVQCHNCSGLSQFGSPFSGTFSCASLRRRDSRGFHSGSGQSQRFVPQHPDWSLLARLVAGSSQRHSKLWRPLRRGDFTEIQAAERTRAGGIQLPWSTEGHSNRQEQHPAPLRRGVGSQGRRQNRVASLLWIVLRPSVARPVFPGRRLRRLDQRPISVSRWRSLQCRFQRIQPYQSQWRQYFHGSSYKLKLHARKPALL